ncbi:polysaccharide pyruvyl transferase family protein [Vibrio chagasii]|uniref:polysaccharide pyruvyl transferase family protein n=1 Tax=Vibrio chagasii TaxID=170679 RepID=UPI00163F7309|nr:polysaccharide pyruvyl transferase family protein [Vibrio chagasii]
MKVFIVNDTVSEMHHGCSRVMNNLRKLINYSGGIVVGSSPVGLDWRRSEKIKQLMLDSDLVIVNGEGSIHHDSSAGVPLLDVGLFCKPYGVKTALVNALFQDMTLVRDEQLAAFDFISVRDSLSKNQIEKYGVEVKLLPDLTFYSKSKNNQKSSKKNDSVWMYTCSVNIEKSVSLYQASKRCLSSSIYEPVIYGKGDWESNVGKNSIVQKFKAFGLKNFSLKVYGRLIAKLKSGEINPYSATCLHNQYEDNLEQVDFLVSGRFHSVCFAINLGLPFVALSSNSHKIEALVKDFGLSKDRIINDVSDLDKVKYKPFTEEEKDNITQKLKSIQEEYEIFFKSMFVK